MRERRSPDRGPYGPSRRDSPSPDRVPSISSRAVSPVAGHGGGDGRHVRYRPSPNRVRERPSPTPVSSHPGSHRRPHVSAVVTVGCAERPSSAMPRPNSACRRRRQRRFTNIYSCVWLWRSIVARSAARLRRTVGPPSSRKAVAGRSCTDLHAWVSERGKTGDPHCPCGTVTIAHRSPLMGIGARENRRSITPMPDTGRTSSTARRAGCPWCRTSPHARCAECP